MSLDQKDFAKKILARATDLVFYSWTQGCEAKQSADKPTGFSDDRACKFCLVGALNRAYFEHLTTDRNYPASRAIDLVHSEKDVLDYGSLPKSPYGMATRAVQDAIGQSHIWSWNDHPSRTKGQVVDVMNKAKTILAKE